MNETTLIHTTEDEHHEIAYHSHLRSEIFHLLPESCDRIVEIGLGTGTTIKAIRKFKQVSFSAGVELDPKIAKIARRHVHEVIDGDIESIDLPDHWTEFDAILCLDILEHLVDPWRVVAALHKRLKPGGVLIASLPNINYIKAVFPLFFLGKWELQDSGVLDRTHLRFFVRNTAVELMMSSGLCINHVEAGGMPKGSKRLWANRITFGIFERFLAMQYYICVASEQP